MLKLQLWAYDSTQTRNILAVKIAYLDNNTEMPSFNQIIKFHVEVGWSTLSKWRVIEEYISLYLVFFYASETRCVHKLWFRYILGGLSSLWGIISMKIAFELVFLIAMFSLCGLNIYLAVQNLNIHDKSTSMPSDHDINEHIQGFRYQYSFLVKYNLRRA